MTGLRRRLGVVLMVTDEEWRELPALTAALCLMVFGAVLGFSAANALFMQHVGGAWLPQTFMVTAAVMLVCTPAYVWMTDRTPRRTQTLLTFLASAAALAAIPWFPSQTTLWIYMVLTMAIYSFTSLVFWLIAADCYDPRQARRLFHVIAAGGSVGAVLAGVSAVWISRHVETHLLSLLWAASLVAALVLIIVSGALDRAPSPGTSQPGTLRQSLHAMRLLGRVPVARPLVWTTAIAVFVGWLINYQFNLTLAEAYPHPHAFADYFAELAAAVSVAAMIAQLGLVGRIMGRLGIVGTMYLAPALLLGPTLVLAVQPTLMVATTCRFLEQFFGLVIVSTCVDTLSSAIPGQRRTAVMALLRTVVTPLAMGGAGLLLMAERFLPGTVVRGTVPLLIGVWMLVLVGLRRRYLDTLISNLSSSDETVRLESLNALERLTDEAVDRVLVESLSSAQPEVAIFALELLREPGFGRLAAAVPPCLASPMAEVRAEAVRTLAWCAPSEAEPRLWTMLADPAPAVREAVVEALDRLLTHGLLADVVAPRLLAEGPARLHQEERPALAAALICTLRRAGWDGSVDAIRAMLARGTVEWRHSAALALAAVDADDPPPEVEMLLRDDDREVRRAAARSLHGPFDGATRALLVAMLREPSVVEAATDGLSTCGPGGVALLRHTLEVEPRIAARVAICEVLGRIGTPDAVDAVAGGLRDRSARVRVAAARMLTQARVPSGLGDLSSPLLATADHMICTAIQLRMLAGRDEPGLILLRDELERQLEESRTALSILVSLAAWGKDDDSAHTLLERPGEERERGISLELVDNALQGPSRKAVLAVVEARDLERLAALDVECGIRWRALSAEQMLEELARSEDTWVSQCARWALDKKEAAKMLTPMEKILFLRQIELFKGIPGRDLAVIAEMAREDSYARGQTIFEEGDAGDALYLIIEGSIAVTSSRRIVEIMGVRECFGEMSILSGEPRSASIETLDETRVLTITRADFRHLIGRYPHITFPIFEMLARRIKRTTEKLAEASV